MCRIYFRKSHLSQLFDDSFRMLLAVDRERQRHNPLILSSIAGQRFKIRAGNSYVGSGPKLIYRFSSIFPYPGSSPTSSLCTLRSLFVTFNFIVQDRCIEKCVGRIIWRAASIRWRRNWKEVRKENGKFESREFINFMNEITHEYGARARVSHKLFFRVFPAGPKPQIPNKQKFLRGMKMSHIISPVLLLCRVYENKVKNIIRINEFRVWERGEQISHEKSEGENANPGVWSLSLEGADRMGVKNVQKKNKCGNNVCVKRFVAFFAFLFPVSRNFTDFWRV